MVEVILSDVQVHALLLFRRQSLHDEDIYRLSEALGSVEEPLAAKDNLGIREQVDTFAKCPTLLTEPGEFHEKNSRRDERWRRQLRYRRHDG